MASVAVAYILWLFGGIFGLHHLYLGRDGQALIWWLSWGGYVLGWLGDSGRISEFVREANETKEERREKLQVLKKLHPKPELNYVTIGSYFMTGHLLSSVIVNAAPGFLLRTTLIGPMLIHILVTLGTATGIYIISNTGPTKSPFLWPFLAGLCLFPVTYIFPDKQPITVVLTTALGAYVSMECSDWREDVEEQDGHQSTLKRLAVIFGVLMLHGSLFTSHMYFNVHITSMNGTQIPAHQVLYNFMKTKPIEQTRNAMFDFYPCMRMYNLDVCQAQFLRTLTEASDPTREDWAFKVLEFDDANLTTRKIQSHCRKLASKFHPDRHRNKDDKERLEMELRFMEIQQACGILNKVKINRERKNTWGTSGMESWNNDEARNTDNNDADFDNNGEYDNNDEEYDNNGGEENENDAEYDNNDAQYDDNDEENDKIVDADKNDDNCSDEL